MRRRAFIGGLAGVVAGARCPAFSQSKSRLARVGYLTPVPLPFDNDFRRGMRELGYVENENLAIEAPFADGKDENLTKLASQLASLPVDVIVATNSAATAAAMRAPSTIPIVMVTSGDPVGSKFVASLARSSNNVTGLSSLAPEISRKQLELIKETNPQITQVTLFWNPLNPSNVLFFKTAEADAASLAVQLRPTEVRTASDLRNAFVVVRAWKPQALVFLIDQVTIAHRTDVVEFANSIGCPAIFSLKEFATAGGLMSFGYDFPDLFFRAASYTDKILKGAKPTDLPIQQPTKFHLVVNLRTAKSLGIDLPTSVLLRADEVIE
jgi:putative ABC transport system substrate-binding protein